MEVETGVKRAYDSSGRRRAAAERRLAILRSAHRLFTDQGYGQTTMDSIADAASVSVETVYLAFKSKAGLLSQVVDLALAGDEAAVSLPDRPQFQEVRAELDQRRQLALLARNARQVLERAGPLQWALMRASAHEPEAATLAMRNEARRLELMTAFMGWVAANGPLADGMTIEEAGLTYWTLASTAVHHQLRDIAGLNADQYERWLARSLQATLLPPTGRRKARSGR